MLNCFVFCGRIVKDIYYKKINEDFEIARMIVAIEDKYKRNDGKHKVSYLNFVGYGRCSTFLKKSFHQGDLICGRAKAENNNYTDRDGNKHYEIIFSIQEIYRMKRKGEVFLGEKAIVTPYDNGDNFDINTISSVSESDSEETIDYASFPDDIELPF